MLLLSLLSVLLLSLLSVLLLSSDGAELSRLSVLLLSPDCAVLGAGPARRAGMVRERRG